MKISRIETFPLLHNLSKPYGDANGLKRYRSSYIIQITTDTGIQGWGECADWLPTLHHGFQQRIIPYLIGKSISDYPVLIRTIQKWHPRSAAAVSMALTEIRSLSYGISICDLWGGRLRDTVPVYASFQSYSENGDWMKSSLNKIEHAVNSGFDKIKVKIGGRALSEDREHINKVQALLECRVGIALDANQSYDLTAILQWQDRLDAWSNLLWLEEPMPMNRIAEYKLLRNRLLVPIAGGENITSTADYIPLLSQQALDYITPDPMHMAGMDRYHDTVRLARSFGVRVTPHCYDGALSRLYAIFAQACLEPWSKMQPANIEPVEWDVMDNPFTDLLPLSPITGTVTVPHGPGIGLPLDLDKLSYYKWDGMAYE